MVSREELEQMERESNLSQQENPEMESDTSQHDHGHDHGSLGDFSVSDQFDQLDQQDQPRQVFSNQELIQK